MVDTLSPTADDSFPPLPPDAVPVQPSIAEQQRQHAEQQDAGADGSSFPAAPTQPPSILDSGWKVAGQQLWDAGTRGLGLGVRDVAAGITGPATAALDVLTWPTRVAQRAAGIPTTAPSDLVTGGLDTAGLPTPNTPREQAISTINRGAASTLPFAPLGTAANALRMAVQGGAGAITGKTLAESDFVPPAFKPTVDLLGNLAGARFADAFANLGAKAVNAVAGNMSPTYQAFVRSGIDPTLVGTMSETRTGHSLEAAATRMPFASSMLGPAQQRTIDQFGNSVDRLATQLDPSGASATAQTTGETLQAAARDWRDTVFPARQAAVWQPLNQRLAGTSVDPTEFRTALEYAASPPGLASLPETQRAWASAQAGRWLDALNADIGPSGNLSWEQAQAIRTRIGDAMGTPEIVAGLGNQQLRGIYGGLARGMQATAAQHGQAGPFNAANTVTTAGHTFIDNTLTKIIRANNPLQESVAPEQATSTVLNAGPTTLQAIRDEMPGAADVLAAHNLRRAAAAKPSVATPDSQTSTGTFMTNMNRMPPESVHALYSSPAAAQRVDDLRTAAGTLRATERHLNTSGTAEQLGWYGYLTGLGGAAMTMHLPTIAAAGIAPPLVGYGAGGLLTNPSMARYAGARGLPAPIVPRRFVGLLGATASQ